MRWIEHRPGPVEPRPVEPKPVEPGPVGPGPEPVSPPVKPVTPPPDPYAPALNFVRNYNGGDCFLALVTSVGDRKAKIDGFASSEQAFYGLDGAFTKAMGWDAEIDGRQVTGNQCPALAFLSHLKPDFRASPTLNIDKDTIRSGDILSGSLEARGANLQFFIVDDQGLVHDVANQLRPVGERQTFAMGLSRMPGSAPLPMLLVALTSAQPLAALKSQQAATAAQVFSAAATEAARLSAPPGVAVKYFKME
jgi:serine/threonine-protein kinase